MQAVVLGRGCFACCLAALRPWAARAAGEGDGIAARRWWRRRAAAELLSIQGCGRAPYVRPVRGLVAAAPAPGVIMGSWIVWLVLAALLGVAEVMTTTLAFGLLAVAAVVAAIVGAVGLGLPFRSPPSPSRRGPVWAWCGRWRCTTSGGLRCCGPEHRPWSGGPSP